MKADILVIGGGPAGLAAALFAKAQGAKVLLIEHNEKLGKKLYITGKGRCNLSNLCDTQSFLENVPRNPRFLYAALAFLPPQKLLDWLLGLGLPTVVERGRRVFPESQKSSDVIKALSRGLQANEVLLNTQVDSLLTRDGHCVGLRLTGGQEVPARAVVLATGGMSYPLTGSTGDGHRMARETGHQVTQLSPALTGLDTADPWIQQVQGLSLRNIGLHANWSKKGKFSEQGELLFTHYGISGPLVLSLSSYLSGLPTSGITASIDLKPALSHQVLMERLQKDIQQNSRKTLGSLLPQYMPASLAAVFAGIIGLSPQLPLHQLGLAHRDSLIADIKALPLTIKGLRPFREAVITRGGVDVKQVDPSTLASRLVSGLFFAGEVLDVDALTGGYNLQIAFSTGALAGTKAAEHIKKTTSMELE